MFQTAIEQLIIWLEFVGAYENGQMNIIGIGALTVCWNKMDSDKFSMLLLHPCQEILAAVDRPAI